MGMTYTKASDPATLEPAELGRRLAGVVADALVWLREISDERAGLAESAGPELKTKWSAKQVIGHLTDSAVNNLGRVVRMQIAPREKMAGYQQEEWVAIQHYSERDWSRVLAVWSALNEQMAWTVSHMERSNLALVGTVEGDEMTLGFLVEDYIAHMEHHLRGLRVFAG
jgi:hypothetical protein